MKNSGEKDWSTVFEENERVLKNFALSREFFEQKREIDFVVSLSSKAKCVCVRKAFRQKFQVPPEGMLIVVDDEEDYRLVLSAKFLLTAKAITDIEMQLRHLTKSIEGSEVSWEIEG